MPLIASIIVCTYNRQELLKESIISLQAQTFPHEMYEIIVVDNNSTDSTREMIEAFAVASPVNIKYLFEPRQGLSYARNSGIDTAQGDIVVFTDDDIEADPLWLAEIVAAFESPVVVCAGGPLRPIWLIDRPDWLTDNLLNYLAVSEFEPARESGEFTYPNYPWGANISFRKDVFNEVGMFPENLGRKGGSLLSNEEINLCRKIEVTGKRIQFVAGAVIHHKMQPDRLKKLWFYHRTFHQGRSDAILDIALGYDLSRLKNLCSTGIWSYTSTDNKSFEVRCARKQTIGYLSEMLASNQCGPRRRIRQFQAYIYEQVRCLREYIHLLNSTNILLAEREKQLVERDRQLEERDRQLKERNQQIAKLSQQIDELHNSFIWRATTPIRWIVDKLTSK